MTEFTHVDERGRSRMVNVGMKGVTRRRARAGGSIRMNQKAYTLVVQDRLPKGDVFAAARMAGIMAAKKTSSLIPLCHPIPLDGVEIDIFSDKQREIRIEATVEATWKTGVEMEALVAVSTALLTFYDMCKAVDRSMSVTEIALLEKSGGKSGTYVKKG
jgi:cyclic pyranopterin phosphate synthase